MRKLAMFVAAIAILSVGALGSHQGRSRLYQLGEPDITGIRYCAGPTRALPTPTRMPEWPLLVSLERVKRSVDGSYVRGMTVRRRSLRRTAHPLIEIMRAKDSSRHRTI